MEHICQLGVQYQNFVQAAYATEEFISKKVNLSNLVIALCQCLSFVVLFQEESCVEIWFLIFCDRACSCSRDWPQHRFETQRGPSGKNCSKFEFELKTYECLQFQKTKGGL